MEKRRDKRKRRMIFPDWQQETRSEQLSLQIQNRSQSDTISKKNLV